MFVHIYLSAVCGIWRLVTTERTKPVYGFDEAIGALTQGQILHFNVKLNTCRLLSGYEQNPEFIVPFGGRVDHYRSANEKTPEPKTYLVFNILKSLYNSTGGLVQLSRQITIWKDNNVTVRSIVYTVDFGIVLYMFEHACTMETTNQTSADVSLRAAGSPNHLFKFDEISQTLENGDELTFSAMVFLCAGAREESFASIGGHITNYDIFNKGGSVWIESTFAAVVHYNDTSDKHDMDVLSMFVYDNRTIKIIDSRGTPPQIDPSEEHVLNCFLQAGMPGGTVSFYAF